MYLKISNKGLTNSAALTVLGVSNSRNEANTIGEFGTGGKFSVCLLLRQSINPVITISNLRMDFFSKPIVVNDKQFNQVCVRYSGKDEAGTKNYTEELSYSSEMGIRDWADNTYMALREFVANSIDCATLSGGSYKDVTIEVVDSPRCQKNRTNVFIPLTESVQKAYNKIGDYFLHFGIGERYLGAKILPKLKPDAENVLIYKKGVLACKVKGNSLFDYNLDDELTLDESRNASDWDVRYACAGVLKEAEEKYLTQIISKSVSEKIWESTLDYNIQGGNKENWQAAFTNALGDDAVLTRPIGSIQETVRRKGFKPVTPLSDQFRIVLESYAVRSDLNVLNENEVAGRDVQDATPEMIAHTDKVWKFLVLNGFSYNKNVPNVKSFKSFTQSETVLKGYYKDDCIYLNQDLGGKELIMTVIEEITHHITQSTDCSRDFQNFLLQIITKFI